MADTYNLTGDALVNNNPARDSAPSVAADKTIKAASSPVTEFNADGSQNSSQSGGQTTINTDTTALKQKGYLHEDGAYGDQELKNSAVAFASGVAKAFAFSGLGTALRTRSSSLPRDKRQNYYLTDYEKQYVRKRAIEFAAPGVTPLDVIEDFLYVLCAIEEYDDLQHISVVTGVPALDNRLYVREPIALMDCPDLYKVGYMAHGLSSITKQFSTSYPQARSSADHTASAYGSLMSVASFASSPIGALTLAYGVDAVTSSLGLSGSAATAAASFFGASGSVSSFPGVGVVGSLIALIVTTHTENKQITAPFSDVATPGYGGTAGKISHVPNAITKLETALQQTNSAMEMIGKQNVASLTPIVGDLYKHSKNIKTQINFANTLKDVQTSNSYNATKNADLEKQLAKIDSGVGELLTDATGIAAKIAAMTGPGDVSKQSTILNMVGGMSTSSTISNLVLGQRIPPSMLCSNPVMQPPSYAGRAFFGEGPAPMIAVDQMFNRRIATYPQASSGAGLQSFQMQNFGSFGSSLSIASLLTRMTYGVSSVPSGSRLASVIDSKALSIGSLLGVASVATALIEPRRSDNAIPMMIALSTVLANDTSCPFATSTFSGGWKMASSVGNDVQKYAPGFLSTARTSL